MRSTPTTAEVIVELKARRKAVLLAHHYQEPDIQEVADAVGDNLELVRAAVTSKAVVIALCGSRFLAETIKVLRPGCTVVLPDLNAGCSLVDSCPVEGVQGFKRRNPGHAIVSFINTSVAVKAESDIVCTSENAVAAVNSIPAKRPLLFVPDINLGTYVQRQTGRSNMQIWQGACIVHATFAARRVHSARKMYPAALMVAHPECSSEVQRMADFVGAASAIIDWCERQSAREFIIATESGIRSSLEKRCPGKIFRFIVNESCNCSECPYLRVNTLEKLLSCLETLQPEIELEGALIEKARPPLERMLALA